MKSSTAPVVATGTMSMKLPSYRFIRDLNGDILAHIDKSDVVTDAGKHIVTIYTDQPINVHNSVFQLSYEGESDE